MPPLLIILLILLLTAVVYFDVRVRRIPNLLTMGGILLGFISSGAVGGWSGLTQSGGGLFIAAMVGFGFWSARLIGGGDHKLLIAVGAFVGYPLIIPIMVAVALAGGLQALIWTGAVKWHRPAQSLRALFKSVRLPYSVSIAVGTLAILLFQYLNVLY